MLFLTTLPILLDFARSKVLSSVLCMYAQTADQSCDSPVFCNDDVCNIPDANCEILTCEIMALSYATFGMTEFGECFSHESGADIMVTCEEDPGDPCEGSTACMIYCPTSSNGECGEPCLEMAVTLDDNVTCEVLEEYSKTSEFVWEECYTEDGTDRMIYCTNVTGGDPSPTAVVPPENCVAIEEWTQDRADELCPSYAHHAYGVELCETYDNPDYRRRLHFSLANQLYSSCSHACLYDYDSYNSGLQHAFRWTGSCYNVAIGYYCILEETTEMHQSLSYAATLCESTEPCAETIGWSQSVAESNCPDGYGSGRDKGWGTAKVCPLSVRLDNGFYARADDLYQASFNFSLANHMFWSCSSKCVYDLVNSGVVYQWKGECWEMQTDWSCITVHWREMAWAVNYITERVCPFPTIEPKPFTCVDRTQDWTEQIAQAICGVDEMGSTNKGADATVCAGHEDYRQSRLDRSLANRAFMSCTAWCVYDIFDTEGAFIWRNSGQCWEPVKGGLCIFGNVKNHNKIKDYIEQTLCESSTDEPTFAPTCMPADEEWSEALMDDHCTVAQTRHTYKHYSSIGRAAVPCAGSEDHESGLLKSLALGMYQDCSAWCVYDYYSDAVLAWRWSNANLCWDLTSWGSCHFDYSSRTESNVWGIAKHIVTLFC